MSAVKLRMTARQHECLRRHLFPGDGLEAVAVALCGRSQALETDVLLVHSVTLIPHERCKRAPDRLDWHPTDLEDLLCDASRRGLAVLKIHSHPSGFADFSSTDDESDRRFFESVYGWVDGDRPHASAIMLPGGRVIARVVLPDLSFVPVRSVAAVGDELRIWHGRSLDGPLPAFAERHAQLFGEGTTRMLGALRVAVVGCSGTGSPVIEQLARLGVGELVLVDSDCVEEKNLNRILGATARDAVAGKHKVDVLGAHVERIGLGTRVVRIPTVVGHARAIRAVAACDFVVGCTDGLSARNLVARLVRYYTLPYVDVGIKLEALADGTINQVAGSVHYLQPDGLDFIDRGVFTQAALEAEDLWLSNPEQYRDRRERGYVRGVAVDRPAVINVNMVFAGLAVGEILARLHPYRMDENADFGTTRLSLSHMHLEHCPDGLASERVRRVVGRGDVEPLLGMPSLSSTGATAA